MGDLDVRRKYHINILGVRTDGKSPAYSRYANGVPSEHTKKTMNMDVRFDTMLHHGDTLLVLGMPAHIQKLL